MPVFAVALAGLFIGTLLATADHVYETEELVAAENAVWEEEMESLQAEVDPFAPAPYFYPASSSTPRGRRPCAPCWPPTPPSPLPFDIRDPDRRAKVLQLTQQLAGLRLGRPCSRLATPSGPEGKLEPDPWECEHGASQSATPRPYSCSAPVTPKRSVLFSLANGVAEDKRVDEGQTPKLSAVRTHRQATRPEPRTAQGAAKPQTRRHRGSKRTVYTEHHVGAPPRKGNS